jgi:hypothetical protein
MYYLCKTKYYVHIDNCQTRIHVNDVLLTMTLTNGTTPFLSSERAPCIDKSIAVKQ